MINKTFYPNYNEVEKWKILDEKVIYSYSDVELPIEIVCVEIGILDVFSPSVFGNTMERTPIVRWMPKTEYHYFKEKRGVVIF